MKFKVRKDEFLSAINSAVKFCSTTATRIELSNFLIEAFGDTLSISATNLESYIKAKVSSVEIISEGKCVLSSKMLSSVVSKMPESEEEITFSLKEGSSKAKLSSGKSKADIIIHHNEFDFPPMPAPSSEFSETSFSLLLSAFKKVSISTDKEENNKIFLDNTNKKMIATDSKRLSFFSFDFGDGVDSVVVPATAMSTILSSIDNGSDKVRISHGSENKNMIFMSNDSFTAATRLFDARMIQYERVIPKNPSTYITVDRSRLEAGIKYVSSIKKDPLTGFNLSSRDNEISLEVVDDDLGDATTDIDCEVEGDVEGIWKFNVKYFLDMLRVCEEDKIKISLSGQSSPALIESDNLTYVVMPMTIL